MSKTIKDPSRVSFTRLRHQDTPGDDFSDVLAQIGQRPKARNSTSLTPAIDLTGETVLAFLSGRGNTGKTTAAVAIADIVYHSSMPMFFGACDRTNRSLESYIPDTLAPESTSENDVRNFLLDAIDYGATGKVSGLIDMGATGEHYLYNMIQAADLASVFEERKVKPVFLHTVATSVDDLVVFAQFQQLSFRPAATALILNEAFIPEGADRENYFALIQKQRCVLDATQLTQVWLPKLDRAVMTEVERRRVTFAAAIAGNTGPRKGATPLGPFDRSVVRRWLAEVEREFAPIRSWFPVGEKVAK